MGEGWQKGEFCALLAQRGTRCDGGMGVGPELVPWAGPRCPKAVAISGLTAEAAARKCLTRQMGPFIIEIGQFA